MDEILTPLRSKGFAASRDFWAKVNERYPLLDLELEALKIVDWLGMPKNAKTRCTLIRVINWLDKAEVDRKQREVDLQAARIAGVPGGGHAPGTNGTARPYVPNLNPEADLPVWDEQKAKASDAGKEEGRRLLEERRRAAAAAAASRPRPQTRSA